MSKIVNYPDDIKGATPIDGWTSAKGVVIRLNPGDKVTLNDETAYALIHTYPFLKEENSSKPEPSIQKALAKESSVEAPKTSTEKEVKQPVKKDPPKNQENKSWKKRAVELGVFKFAMTTEAGLKAIKEAENGEA